MTENNTADTTDEGRASDATPDEETVSTTTDSPDDEHHDDTPEATEETFSRSYVEELRQENGKYRQRAAKADDLAHRLHTELVRATGKLADPTDLPYSEGHLADADSMVAAINELLTKKPHLAARRPIGDIGQGMSPPGGTVDLAAILRGKAG